jgi:hypothetical protein
MKKLECGPHILLYVAVFLPAFGNRSVPLNVDFVLHRQSEWIMLNFGESIFSLLIVYISDEGRGFFTVFYCGVATVILLNILHFRSQPLHADHHALRRHKNAGILHNGVLHIYSLGLVSLGAAYTFFLTESEEQSANLAYVNTYIPDTTNQTGTRRRLVEASTFDDTEKFYKNIAKLFCISLALVFTSLDLMTLCHLGFEESKERCYCRISKQRNVKGFLLIATRICLILFTGTMDLWVQDIQTLSIAGLILVVAQLMLRKLGSYYLRKRGQVHPTT